MQKLQIPTYNPPFWLRNGHINTIYSSKFRKIKEVPFQRTMIRTVDDDGLFVDIWTQGFEKMAVLCHGLEGSSQSTYIQSLAHLLNNAGWDVMAINFRSCGKMNKQLRMYHSGETSDLHTVLRYHQSPYQQIALIGFSLGGNVILKYMGEDPQRVHHKVTHAIGVSVPIDLAGSSKVIGEKTNFLYNKMFLDSLKTKIQTKHNQFPEKVDLSYLPKVKTLVDFDEYYTSRLHGFENAEDYYRQSNALQFLHQINRPSWLITALDDPFLSTKCFPHHIDKNSYFFNLVVAKHGGHVGFSQPGHMSWHEEVILKILEINQNLN